MTEEIPQQPDAQPGRYYVSMMSDDGRLALLLGPFVNDHAGALALIDAAREKAYEVNPYNWFHAFGTVRYDLDGAPKFGKLNSAFGMPIES